MSLVLQGTKSALTPNKTASFLASGGTAPFTYSVQPGGAGGTIDQATGIYTAPSTVHLPPDSQIDVIEVTDSSSAPLTATLNMMIGTPLDMLLDIIQTQVGLDDDHISYYNQKGFQPDDNSLYCVLKIVNLKPYGNRRYNVDNGGTQGQTCNTAALIDINIFSRDMSAVYQKEQVLMSLASQYSETQQEGNGFKLPRIPMGFVDISEQDGAAMLFRFVVSISMIYSTTKGQTVDYYKSFPAPVVTTQP